MVEELNADLRLLLHVIRVQKLCWLILHLKQKLDKLDFKGKV